MNFPDFYEFNHFSQNFQKFPKWFYTSAAEALPGFCVKDIVNNKPHNW